MKKSFVLTALLLGVFSTLPGAAQLQYYGYVAGADDDVSLNSTKDFTNFAALSTSTNLSDPTLRTRISAMSSAGIKAFIDLGGVLWCDYTPDDDSYDYVLCSDYQQRWATWAQNNAAVLTADKVVAISVRDEPFRWGVNMAEYDALAQMVKTTFPWVKVYLADNVCGIEGYCPVGFAGQPVYPTSYATYQGNLPNVDWISLEDYGIYPATDSTYRNDLATFKSRFPGKKWMYVIDGFWDSTHSGVEFISNMRDVAQQWYDLARNDPDAVVLGVFGWGVSSPGFTTSRDFPCSVLSKHVEIGRAVTGKTRHQTLPPVGSFSIDSSGVVSGSACDPDGTLCEDPQVNLYVDGSFYTTTNFSLSSDYVLNAQCRTGTATRFTGYLGTATSGHQVTASARDLDGATAGLSSTCAENPACVWYSHVYRPKGYMDGISPTGYATGWVCDQDAPLISSQVRLASSSGYIGLYTTNLGNESAVTSQCSGGTLHRFGVQLPAATKGLPIYAYAEDLGSPYTRLEVQIAWLCPAGWSCTW